MFAFTAMASCPPDPEGAACFRAAIGTYPLQNVAADCDVAPSMVTKWLTLGNVPESRIDKLPEDIKRRYAELQAKRRGAVVIERDLVQAAWEFVLALRPCKASLAPAEDGALSRRRERVVAA